MRTEPIGNGNQLSAHEPNRGREDEAPLSDLFTHKSQEAASEIPPAIPPLQSVINDPSLSEIASIHSHPQSTDRNTGPKTPRDPDPTHGPQPPQSLPLPDEFATNDGDFTKRDQHREKPSFTKRYVFPTLIGFTAGVVFWHFVGFWSFVSEAVFSGPRERIAVDLTKRSQDKGVSSIETGSIPKATQKATPPQAALSSANCETLAIDPKTQRMKLVPCPLGTPASPNSDQGFNSSETHLNQNNNPSASSIATWQAKTRTIPQQKHMTDRW